MPLVLELLVELPLVELLVELEPVDELLGPPVLLEEPVSSGGWPLLLFAPPLGSSPLPRYI